MACPDGAASSASPDAGAAGPPRLLLSTGVGHTASRLRTAARDAGGLLEPWSAGAVHVLELLTGEPDVVLTAAARALSSMESAEVRAAVVPAAAADREVVALALSAPSLATAVARIDHAALRRLFDDEETTFHSEYQPIVDLRTTRVVGHEALLRATDPDGERVMPTELFDVAARTGWTHLLDRIGRTTALRHAGPWLGDDLLFVNFVPTSIYRPEVCLASTEKAAADAGIAMSQLVFEVTEGERVEDVEHLAQVFAYYRRRGARTALDDLGSGWSSLSLLVRLQPDVVKLDRELVQALPHPSATSVVRAAVDIARSYGGTVLAEGIETEEQAEAVRRLDVDLGQGWRFGRPSRRPGTAGLPAPRARREASIDPEWPDVTAALMTTPTGQSGPLGEAAPQELATRAGPGSGAAPVPAHGAELTELLARAVAASSSGVIVSDARNPDQPIVYVNSALERLSGYASADLLGRNCRVLQGEGTDRATTAALGRAIARGEEASAVVLNERPDGSTWWNELRLSPVRDTAGVLTHWFGFQADVSARREAEDTAARGAVHDDLTGLLNRTSLLSHLDEVCGRARSAGRRVAVLSCDLDGFRAVNEQMGQRAGDAVLVQVASRLRGALRTTDTLGRCDGDEFVAVLADLPPEAARRVADDVAVALEASLAEPLRLQGRALPVCVTVGVAVLGPDGPHHPDELPELHHPDELHGADGADRRGGLPAGDGEQLLRAADAARAVARRRSSRQVAAPAP